MSGALDIKDQAAAVRPTAAARAPGSNLFEQPLIPMLTAVGVAVLVVTAILFARTAGMVCALWGASGLAAVVWLRSKRGLSYEAPFALLIAVGVMAGELMAGNSIGLSMAFTAANMLEIVLVIAMTRRLAPGLQLNSVESAARYLLLISGLAPVPSALIVAGVLAALNNQTFFEAFQTWWFAHALGFAVLGAMGLSATRQSLAPYAKPVRALEALGILGIITAVCTVVFSGLRMPVGFVLLPLLLITAVRLKVLGTSLALGVIALTAIGSAMLGHGPYTTAFQGAQQAMMAQILVVFGFMPMIFVAALLEERDIFARRAREGQERAEQASEAKSRLLANVAHEIKSPVGGVIGIGDLWRTGQLGPVNETQAEMAEMLVKTARQIEALSYDLLDVARAESGAVKVDLRPTDVPGLLEDVRRATALRPEAKALWMEVQVEGEGLIALADSQRLMQVVSNLASNAVKYGGSGGSVVFRASRVRERIRLEVVDRGPGLSLQKQSQLFEPFNRLGLERSAIEGHGVGLALAKRLTELQHGVIGVESQPDEGATFWVELPAA